ncbi:MAG: IS3 family transposase [Umezawaea sp.]
MITRTASGASRSVGCWSSRPARKTRRPSARAQYDEELLARIRAVHGVYGARRVWHQLRRDGV